MLSRRKRSSSVDWSDGVSEWDDDAGLDVVLVVVVFTFDAHG